MIRNAFIDPVLLLLNQNFSAPKFSVTILKATQQSWSGGIARMHGEKFFVEFQTLKNFVPDTFHFNGFDIPVQFYPGSAKTEYQYNCTKTLKGNITTYKLNINFSYPNDEIYGGRNPYNSNSDLPKQKKYPYRYELKFSSGEVYCISKYETLEPLAYP